MNKSRMSIYRVNYSDSYVYLYGFSAANSQLMKTLLNLGIT